MIYNDVTNHPLSVTSASKALLHLSYKHVVHIHSMSCLWIDAYFCYDVNKMNIDCRRKRF